MGVGSGNDTCQLHHFGYQKCAVRHKYKKARFQQRKITDAREFGHQRCDATHCGANYQRQCEYATEITNRSEERIHFEFTGARVVFAVVLNWTEKRQIEHINIIDYWCDWFVANVLNTLPAEHNSDRIIQHAFAKHQCIQIHVDPQVIENGQYCQWILQIRAIQLGRGFERLRIVRGLQWVRSMSDICAVPLGNTHRDRVSVAGLYESLAISLPLAILMHQKTEYPKMWNSNSLAEISQPHTSMSLSTEPKWLYPQ